MDTIKIKGIQYRVVKNATVRQRLALQRALKEAGTFDKRPEETEDELFARVFDSIIDSGVWAKLISAQLVPVGKTWTPEIAAMTEAALDQADDLEETDALVKLVGWLIASFFATGMISQSVSRAYSSAVSEAIPEEGETLTIRLVFGDRWFGRLLASTLYAWKAFWTGMRMKSAAATSNS